MTSNHPGRCLRLKLLFLGMLLARAVYADEWPMEAVYSANETMVVPIGDVVEKHVLNLPAVPPQKGKRLCLRFKAYLEFPKPGGWNPYLAIAVNDRPLGPSMATGENRLLNRGVACDTTLGPQSWWGRSPSGGEALLTFFGPGDVLDERVVHPRDEPYWYVLDISDVANYVQVGADQRIESSHPNVLTFANTCLKKYLGAGSKTQGMIIDSLAIGYLPEELVVQHQRAGLIEYKGEKAKERIATGGFAVVVTESAGLRIDIHGDRYFIASSFSYPSQKIAFHRFDPDAVAGAEGWAPKIGKVDGRTIRIEAEGKQYKVTRTLSLQGARLRVRDQIANTTGGPIGVLVNNRLAISGFPRPDTYFLGGVENQVAPGSGFAENPTVFLAQKQSSIGIVAEDNIYRLQLTLARRVNGFDLTAQHFGLDGGQSYALEWTIYPRTDRDYWAFINEVRRDWRVNFTILGPFAFGGLVKGRQTRIATIGPWVDYDDGAAISREQYQTTWSKVVKKLRDADPNLIVMPKVENNLITIDKRQVAGGETLPTSQQKLTGKYGRELTRPQTAVLDRHPLADSVVRTADGRMVVDTYYAQDPFLNLMVYPAPGNTRLKLYFDQIDFLMDQVGFNGIYIDQFSLAWGGMDRMDRRTLERWDGHTVDIDEKTGQIIHKYTDCALVGAAARAEVLNYILRKGGQVVVNSFPCVRETQALPVFRFAEMENDPIDPLAYLKGKPPVCPSQAKGHLASPIVLGLRPARWGQKGKDQWAELITKAVITGLRNGLLYYYYTGSIPDTGPGAGDYGPVNHMFPFTPVELHSGWLVGRERIITCLSGTYEWKDQQPPVCHRFNLTGREVPHGFTLARRDDRWQVKVALDDWNELAVLEGPTATDASTRPAE